MVHQLEETKILTAEDDDGREEGVLGVVDAEQAHHATEVEHGVRDVADGRRPVVLSRVRLVVGVHDAVRLDVVLAGTA